MSNDLARHYRATMRLGLPLLLGQVGQVILGFVDSAMIGHYGVTSLSAASFTLNLLNLPIVIALGYSYGLTPLVGQAYGRGERHIAGAWLRRGLTANLTVNLFLALAMTLPLLFIDQFGLPQEVIPLVKPYYITHLISLPFIGIFNGFKQFADAIDRPSYGMWIMIGANLLNILGNWLLIYGHWGFPELGLLGAGIATLIARILMAAAFAALLLLPQNGRRRYRLGFYRPYRIPLPPSARMHQAGGFIGLQMGLETSMFSLAIILVGWLGTTALAAHHVAMTIQTLGFMIYYGAGAATSVRVSQHWGRADLHGSRLAARAGVLVTITLAAIMVTLLLILRFPLARLFSEDQTVIALAATLLLVGIAYQPADALQIAYANALRATGEGVSLAIIAFIGYFAVGLPLAYLFAFPLKGGLIGVWLAFPIGLALAALGYAIRLKRVFRNAEEKDIAMSIE